MNTTVVVIIVMVVATIFWFFGMKIMKNTIMKRLIKDLQKQDFDDYYKTVDSFATKLLIPPFNREYMRMNGLIMQGRKGKVEEQFDLMLNMRMNQKQEIDIVMKAFSYYMEDENKRRAKQLLERVRKFGDDYYNESKIMYDVYLEKSTEYIASMEEALKQEDLPEMNRGMFMYLLGLQYGNDNQKKKMRDYLRDALPLLKNTPYELKIRTILKD